MIGWIGLDFISGFCGMHHGRHDAGQRLVMFISSNFIINWIMTVLLLQIFTITKDQCYMCVFNGLMALEERSDLD